MAAISNDDFLDTSITENWNCPKSRAQRSGSKVNQKPSLFSDPRRKSCITEFEADLGKKKVNKQPIHIIGQKFFKNDYLKKLVRFFFFIVCMLNSRFDIKLSRY